MRGVLRWVIVDTVIHVGCVIFVALLYHFEFLRRLVLRLRPRQHSLVKRLQLVALYLEVPIVRRSVLQWGVSRVFPGFLQEMSQGALKTTSFTMQKAVLHAPFVFVPSLPQGPFLDSLRTKLPVLKALEQEFPRIREELQSLLERKVSFDEFFGTWETYDFYLYGRHLQKHMLECPVTSSFLSRPEWGVLRNSQCGFSRLCAQDCIGYHCDAHSTNLRVRIHLALIVPPSKDEEPLFFECGNQQRRWEEGKTLVFDTTFQHRAVNGTDVDRYVLLFDVWNPALGQNDIEALKRLDRAFDHE